MLKAASRSWALVSPPEVTGAYQTVPYNPALDIAEGLTYFPTPSAYGDTAVIAYRVPNVPSLPTAGIRTDDGQDVDPKDLIDPAARAWICPSQPQIRRASLSPEYQTPQTIRSATIFLPKMATSYYRSFPE